MGAEAGHLESAESLAAELEASGYKPVLVGGMALVVLGSRRVTRDFDLLVTSDGPPIEELVRLLYRHDLELVTKFDAGGEVLRTVDNATAAAAKVKGTRPRPTSLFFFNSKTGLKVDLLIDFPLPARGIYERAIRFKLKSQPVFVASVEDLIRLKEIAYADRKSASDAQDLEFLRKKLKVD